ncbi:MAG: hypothetical protein ACKVVO_16290, partial [Opitutaceae bacterium]
AAYIEWSKSHGSLVEEESFNSETYFKHVKFSASIQPWISQIADRPIDMLTRAKPKLTQS